MAARAGSPAGARGPVPPGGGGPGAATPGLALPLRGGGSAPSAPPSARRRPAGAGPPAGLAEPAATEARAVQPQARGDAADERCVQVLTGHTGFVLSLCAVGDVLFSGSQDGSIIIWDLNNLQYIGALPGHRGFVKCLAATMARKMLFSGSQDKTIKVWSLETFAATKTLVGHTSEVNALVALEDSDALVSGSEDRSVRVWSLAALVPTACFDEVHAGGVFALSPLAEGLLSAGRDRCIKWWPAASSSPPLEACQALQPPHYDSVTGLAVGRRKGHFYSVSRDRSVRRWDTQSLESDLQLTSAHGDWLTSVALSHSEDVLFTGSKDTTVRVWDAELRSCDVLQGHSGPVSALLVVDRHLFSASHDRTVRVWRADQFEG
ncbi:unnamed protein product [Prorocentrum cordatum]|uniref:Uncharacterized protein n=1 Tax=Prorocentrum cordatum TaxID=2364126 RepID=A0ABN9WTS3_9DINO|nr:unnamed protein product [Polarella glacialis]